jgi:putative addiction module component (TIGR02574 family)
MKMSTDDLLVEALRLSREERARIAAELLSSLEEMDDEVVAAWAEELRRRSVDVREGRVSAVPWTTAREEILIELADRRARRTSS